MRSIHSLLNSFVEFNTSLWKCRNAESIHSLLTALNGISIIHRGQSVALQVVSHRQTFRLTAEGMEYMAAFIFLGPPLRLFDLYVKKTITVRFVQRHVSGLEMLPQ